MSVTRATVLKVRTSNKIYPDGRMYDRVKLRINQGKPFEVTTTQGLCEGQSEVHYDTSTHQVTRIQPAHAQNQE